MTVWELLQKHRFVPFDSRKREDTLWHRERLYAVNYYKTKKDGHTIVYRSLDHKQNVCIPYLLAETIPDEKVKDVEAVIKSMVVISELG